MDVHSVIRWINNISALNNITCFFWLEILNIGKIRGYLCFARIFTLVNITSIYFTAAFDSLCYVYYCVWMRLRKAPLRLGLIITQWLFLANERFVSRQWRHSVAGNRLGKYHQCSWDLSECSKSYPIQSFIMGSCRGFTQFYEEKTRF